MKKSKFTDTQIISVLREVEGGMKVEEVCRKRALVPPPITNGSPNLAAWMLRNSSESESWKKKTPSLSTCTQTLVEFGFSVAKYCKLCSLSEGYLVRFD